MKFVRLHIDNFGKFSNFDLAFSENINQFIFENGWGKSTLCAFIKAMLYGMEAKGRRQEHQSDRSKYAPWKAGNYGGNLTIKIKEKEYQIFRTFGKTPEDDSFQLLDANRNKISQDYTEEIAKQLFGVGIETFSISAFFGQNNLSCFSTDEMVSNLAGIEKYSNDGEKTNSAIKLIEKKRKELVANLPKEAHIKQIENNLEKLNMEIENKSKYLKNVAIQSSQIRSEKQEFEKKFDMKKEKEKQQKNIIEEKAALQEKLNNKNLELSRLVVQKSALKLNLKLLLVVLFSFVFALLFIVLSVVEVLSIELGIAVGFMFLVIAVVTLFFSKPKEHKNTNQAIYSLNNEITELTKLIENLSCAEDIDNDSLYEQKVEFEQKFAELYAKQASLTNEIENMQEEYAILLDNKIKLEEIRSIGLEKIELLKKTVYFLQKARENVSERFVMPLNNNFKDLLKNFKQFEEISIDSSLVPWVITSQGAKNVEFLSQGLKDLVVICQRFSLLDKIYKKEKPCIILDDSFVNLDDQNFTMVSPILQKLSEKYQIIYFACSQSRKIK